MPTKDGERERWLLQHHMVPDQLETMAARIRDTYARFRRQFFPGYRVNSKKHHQKFWWDTAIMLHDREVDVEDFISICFNVMGAKTVPEMIKSDKMLLRYEENKQPLYDQAASLLQLYAGKLQRALINDKRPVEQILDDPRNDFGELFIWCVAQIRQLPELVTKYEGDAQRLLLNPMYRKVYGDAFTEVVK